MSRATDTTSRLVEVPMVVTVPPITVARPKGMSTPEGEDLALSVTPTRIGSSMTTIGVLFTTALSAPATTMVKRSETTGAVCQTRARMRATGCSAPVVSSPFPSTMSAHTATSASWPKPAKRSDGRTGPPSPS